MLCLCPCARMLLQVLAAAGLSAGDRVLIAEACNHNRITDACNDIGMVQIPDALRKLVSSDGSGSLVIEHAFGRCAKKRTRSRWG